MHILIIIDNRLQSNYKLASIKFEFQLDINLKEINIIYCIIKYE
jgi:hypothetical protein